MPTRSITRKEIEASVKQLQPLPRTVTRLMELLENDDATVEQIESLIVADPVLCGRVLQMANSAYYGLGRSVSAIRHALLMLGRQAIKGIALSVAVVGAFQTKRKISEAERRLWRHAFYTALCAQGVAYACKWGVRTAEDAYIAGLLHDIGALFLQTQYPKLYCPLTEFESEHTLLEREAQVFGYDHADVGALIADHWCLPERIVQAIAYHHAPCLPDDESRPLVAAVLMVEAWHHPAPTTPPELAMLIRLTDEAKAQIQARAKQQTEVYEQMLFA